MKLLIIAIVLACGVGWTFAVSNTTVKPDATTAETQSMTTTSPTTTTPSLEQQVDELNDEVDELYDIVDQNEIEANETISSLESEIAELDDRVDELEDELDTLKDQAQARSSVRTCQDYYDAGIRESGYRYIDPDGSEDEFQPFVVYCNMTAVPGYGVTEFGHDSEARTLVNGCEDPDCYKRNVTYNQTMEQIRAVVTISENCRQFTKYECKSSMMFSYEREASWLSYDSVRQYYWGGADPGSEMCACGKSGDCDLNSATCNCDNNDYVWREDYGYVSNKTTLPVKQLAFGDTEALDERGYHTLGRLQCYGLSTGDGKSCADIKAANSTSSSGYYSINPNPGVVSAFQVYCDMSAYPGTGVAVVHHDEESKTKIYAYSYYEDVDVTYDVDLDQIAALTDISTGCTQYIEWQCYRTGLLSQGSYWLDRNGHAQYYWGGASPNHDYFCACGESGTCSGGYNYKCNCDYTTSTTFKDGGELIDKSVLPVTKMRYYFYYYSSSSYYGYYTLGPLHCF